jgi:hypothetical protein
MFKPPVIEVVKIPITPAQFPDVISSVPFIEVEVQLALKEAVSVPVCITNSRRFPVMVPERLPVDIHSEPLIDAVPLTEVLL